MVAPDTFIFLNERRTLAGSTSWNDPGIEKLWLYNLHYFDDLNAEGASDRREWHAHLIDRWVAENPPGYGNGWEPYPASLRIVNWIKYALNGGALSPHAVASLAVQVRYLSERLEFHLLGNHLLANAKALVFAGAFFNGREAESWLARGEAILRREIPEQILGDGGHFELSPMYHSILLEDLLDLVNVSRAYGLATMIESETIGRMRDWLATMCHPDGEIAFFNDATFGIAPTPSALDAYAQRLGYSGRPAMPDGVRRLDDSGYIRLQHGNAVLLTDIAQVGPSYLPGHAHADTLSFELSVGGHRVMVNSGTSCYGSGPERQRQRGTAAHNTLVVNGEDSSEVWGGFRVARRAKVRLLQVASTPEGGCIEAVHDGYRRLPGHNLHRRRWLFGKGTLLVEDEVTGAFNHAAVRLHLHPEVGVEMLESSTGEARLQMPGGNAMTLKIEGGTLSVEQSTWHPHFGVAMPNSCLVATLGGARMTTHITWGEGA